MYHLVVSKFNDVLRERLPVLRSHSQFGGTAEGWAKEEEERDKLATHIQIWTISLSGDSYVDEVLCAATGLTSRLSEDEKALLPARPSGRATQLCLRRPESTTYLVRSVTTVRDALRTLRAPRTVRAFDERYRLHRGRCGLGGFDRR
jgi:hypothetical protein